MTAYLKAIIAGLGGFATTLATAAYPLDASDYWHAVAVGLGLLGAVYFVPNKAKA